MTTQEIRENSAKSAGQQATTCVPAWCTRTMEVGVLGALASATFAASFSDKAVWLSGGLTLLATLMWLMHAVYLRRLPIVPGRLLWIFTALAGGGVVFIMGGVGTPFGPESVLVAACVLTFLVVSGGFTEQQVSRYLGFVGLLGLIHVVGSLIISRVEANPAGNWQTVLLFGDQWPGVAFLGTCLLALGTTAAHAADVRSLDRDPGSLHSRVAWFSSPGVQIALLGVAGITAVFFFLYLFPTLIALPVCSVLFAAWAVGMGAKGKVSGFLVTCAVVSLLGLNLLSLARPAGEPFVFTSEAFEANVARLQTGRNVTGMVRVRENGPTPGHTEGTGRLRPGWFSALTGSVPGRVTGILLLVLVLFSMGLAARGMIVFDGSESVLAACGLFGVLGLVLFVAMGECLAHPGVAMSGAGLLAIAAAQGSFEQEVEE